MPLKLNALYRQVERMAIEVPSEAFAQQLTRAQQVLHQIDLEALHRKLRQRERGTAKIPWLVARPTGTLAGRFPVPLSPEDWTIVATDGSSIPPDRHSPVRYYVLNIGHATLTYGHTPNAVLESQEQFCFEEDDLYFDPMGKRIPIEETRLGMLMGIRE